MLTPSAAALVGVVCYQSMNQAATARGLLGNWTTNTGHLAHTLTPIVYDHNFITLLRIDLSADCSLAYRCVSQVDPEIDRSEANIDQLYRSIRLLALLTTQLDSAPRRSTRST